MRRIPALPLLTVVLFIALLVLTVAIPTTTGTALGRSGSVFDDGPGGAAILRRYLEALGTTVVPVQGDRFSPNGAGVQMLFLLGASDTISVADRQTLHDFVRLGGTLVVATDLALNERRLLDEFGAPPASSALPAGRVAVRTAAFAPPVRAISIDYGVALAPRDVATTLVAAGGSPVVVVASEGRGTVYVVGSLAPFLNETIGEVDNGRLALALTGGAARVGFDEYHHGVRPAPTAPSITALLTGTWPGRAMLAAGVIVFLYVLLTGRRLGPPLPLDPRPPRSSIDYVRSFGGLARRSGRGEIPRRRLSHELERELAKQAGLDPRTDFARVTQAIASHSPARAAEAQRLHAALAGRLRDDALVRAANDVARLIRAEETT